MKKFMKENYLNSNIKLNRFNGFLSVNRIHTPKQNDDHVNHPPAKASGLLASSIDN